jgi:acyl dehydratase
MGDDAWLWKLDCEFRKFNYVGDTQWLSGTVTRRYLAAGDRPAVDLELTAVNQRGEVTTPGHATILLPSHEHGPVRLPDPPGGATDLQGALDAIEPATYDDADIERIEAQYAAEEPRGAAPRWFEDVAEGDAVGPMVKGPLTVTDIVCWHVGMGMGLYGVAPLRLGATNRRRIPRFYHRDTQGVPDVMQRVHWDPEFAKRSGNPTTFDYGRMRETWLIHLCTDWMGDDAWLWKLDCEFRRFNYVGDTQWLSGTVTRRYLADGDRPAVDLEIGAVNQRGELTTPGHATVLLPSREHGLVRLPDPPGGATDLQQALDAIAEEFAAGQRGSFA